MCSDRGVNIPEDGGDRSGSAAYVPRMGLSLRTPRLTTGPHCLRHSSISERVMPPDHNLDCVARLIACSVTCIAFRCTSLVDGPISNISSLGSLLCDRSDDDGCESGYMNSAPDMRSVGRNLDAVLSNEAPDPYTAHAILASLGASYCLRCSVLNAAASSSNMDSNHCCDSCCSTCPLYTAKSCTRKSKRT